MGGQPPEAHIRDYDLFSWDADTSYEGEDAVIRRANALFADLNARTEVRNQARVHLWFPQKHGLTRPPLRSAREGIEQFLMECTCVGVDARGELYAPFGLAACAPTPATTRPPCTRQRWPTTGSGGRGCGRQRPEEHRRA